jgi:hypothetical protein
MLRRDVGVATSIRSPSLSGNRAITSRTCSQTPRRLVTASGREPASRSRLSISGRRRMERETGIEPATNSLEGCDSTTELLPPSFTHFAPNFGEASPRSVPSLHSELRRLRCSPRSPLRRGRLPARLGLPRSVAFSLTLADVWLRLPPGLPSVAHSRCSGERRLVAREGLEPSKPLGRQIYSLLRLTASLPRQESVFWNPCVRRVLCCLLLSVFLAYRFEFDCRATQVWSWRRDSNPRPADYKSAALPA